MPEQNGKGETVSEAQGKQAYAVRRTDGSRLARFVHLHESTSHLPSGGWVLNVDPAETAKSSSLNPYPEDVRANAGERICCARKLSARVTGGEEVEETEE